MKGLIKNAVLLSVYHIETVTAIEVQMKKEDKDDREVKQKITIISTVNTLLGILYND